MKSIYGDRSIMLTLTSFLNAYLESNYEGCLHFLESLKKEIDDIRDKSYQR